MNLKITKFIIIFAVLFSINNALGAENSAADFEQALKNIETQKNQDREKLSIDMHSKLNQVIDKWILTQDAAKKAQINQIVQQNWEKLDLIYPFSPLHYDYFLRGHVYEKGKSDIKETDSISATFKAETRIKEILYVERKHPPEISNRDPYFFTVTNEITLSLEYVNNNFEITKTNGETISMENNCPEELKKMRI